MKRIFTLLLTASLIFGLIGCSDDDPPTGGGGTTAGLFNDTTVWNSANQY